MDSFVCTVKNKSNKFFRIKKEESKIECPNLSGRFNSRKQACTRWAFKLHSKSFGYDASSRFKILLTNFFIVRQNPSVLVFLSDKDYIETLTKLEKVVGKCCHIETVNVKDIDKALTSMKNFDLVLVDTLKVELDQYNKSDILTSKNYQIMGY